MQVAKAMHLYRIIGPLFHIVKPSFWRLRRKRTGSSTFLGPVAHLTQLLGGSNHPDPQLSRGFRPCPSFLDCVTPSCWGRGFVPAFWAQLPRTDDGLSVKPAFRAFSVKPAFRTHIGYHTSFLGVAAFRHSFGQTQLSGHASFLVTFVNLNTRSMKIPERNSQLSELQM